MLGCCGTISHLQFCNSLVVSTCLHAKINSSNIIMLLSLLLLLCLTSVLLTGDLCIYVYQ